jgi:hypothetical protein
MAKIDLEKMAGTEVPSFDWKITEVLDDVIMTQFVDTDKSGDYINRNGILVKLDVTKQVWRVAKVVLRGPKCSPKIQPGVHVIFPNNLGIHVPEVGQLKLVCFISEDKIFGICEPK